MRPDPFGPEPQRTPHDGGRKNRVGRRRNVVKTFPTSRIANGKIEDLLWTVPHLRKRQKEANDLEFFVTMMPEDSPAMLHVICSSVLLSNGKKKMFMIGESAM